MAEEFAGMRRTDTGEKEQILQMVGFNIGSEQFGVDILMVQEIIRAAPITPVPNSPDFVEGVINLRGDIIPVIDLRKRLNLYINENDSDNWIIILDIGGKVTGFIVDAVSKVMKILENSIEPPPDLVVAGLESQYIQGVCDIGNNILILLDFNRILLIEEFQSLKKMEET